MNTYKDELVLYHHGVKGQRWGVRRYRNYDGTLTAAGKARYGTASTSKQSTSKQSTSKQPTSKQPTSKQSTSKKKFLNTVKLAEDDMTKALADYYYYDSAHRKTAQDRRQLSELWRKANADRIKKQVSAGEEYIASLHLDGAIPRKDIVRLTDLEKALDEKTYLMLVEALSYNYDLTEDPGGSIALDLRKKYE